MRSEMHIDDVRLITKLRTGTEPTGTLDIEENGTYGVNDYAAVEVSVPDPELQTKAVTPTKQEQEVTPDAGIYGLEKVTVHKIPDAYIIPEGTREITENGTYDVTDKATAAVNIPIPEPELQTKTVTPTKTAQDVEADAGYDGLNRVHVNSIPSEYIIPAGDINISANGTVDVTEKARALVNVQPTLQTKTATPKKTTQQIIPDTGYDGLEQVNIAVIPDEFRRMPALNAPSRTASWFDGVTINSSQVIRILDGSEAPEIGEKITIQPIITNYIGTQSAKACITGTVTNVEKNGSSILVTIQITDKFIDNIPAGTQNITENGTYNVKDKAEAVVNVPGMDDYISNIQITAISSTVEEVRTYGMAGLINLLTLDLPEVTKLGQYALEGMSMTSYLNNTIRLVFPKLKTIIQDAFKYVCAQHIWMPALETASATEFNVQGTISIDIGKMASLNGSPLRNLGHLRLIAIHKTDGVTVGPAWGNASKFKQGQGFVLVPRDMIASYQTATNWVTAYNAGTQFWALEDYTLSGTAEGLLDQTKIDALLAA